MRRQCRAAREDSASSVGRVASSAIPQRSIKQGSRLPQDAAPVSRHRSARRQAGENSVAAHNPLKVIDIRSLTL